MSEPIYPDRCDGPQDVWPTLVGYQADGALPLIFRVLKDVDPDHLREGLRRIEHETALGPLLDPSAYVGGKRFDNMQDYRDVLQATLSLVETLRRIVLRDVQS